MALHPDAQKMILKVEELSGRLVHVIEDPYLELMASIQLARGIAPAHILRYRPGTQAVDYLICHQLGFLVRLFSCPEEERWQVLATKSEHDAALNAMGLKDFPQSLADSMVNSIVIQLRTFPVGSRVDDWILQHCPTLREQQEHSVRAQMADHAKALAPEIRGKFPKPLIDANSAMNAAYALNWGRILGDERFFIPYKALGYGSKAMELLEFFQSIPDDPLVDRALVEAWAKALGLSDAFHFASYQLS